MKATEELNIVKTVIDNGVITPVSENLSAVASNSITKDNTPELLENPLDKTSKPKKNARASNKKKTAPGSSGSKKSTAANKKAKITKEPQGRVPEALPVEEGESFETVRSRLHVSAVPKSLPGRSSELADISAQLYSSIVQDSSCCLYISGVPGTGKTATVRAAIRELQSKVDSKELPSFNFLEINGMQVTDPNQTYVKLWEAIGKQKVTHLHALDRLRDYFQGKQKTGDRPIWVVLVDELDLLMTKKQGVMYNLFEWPYCPNSRMIVVAIANTMDLPERMLTNKVASRMGLVRVVFHPYTFPQLYDIVSSRLLSVPWFESDAIEMCARKVAAVSGDARRALDICRRAVEIVEAQRDLASDEAEKRSKKVQISTINTAFNDMYKSPAVKFVASCSFQQKIVLVAILMTIKSTGLTDVIVSKVLETYTQTCRFSNWTELAHGRVLKVITSLVSFNILMASCGQSSPIDHFTTLAIVIRPEDVSIALKLEDEFKNLI